MLGLRLLQQFMDKPNEHAVKLLDKLGTSFYQGQAPLVGKYVKRMAELQQQELPEKRPYPDPQLILSAISEAWLECRKVEIWYEPLHSRKPFHDTIHPYFIEPSAIGHSTYVIGYSEYAQALRIYKLVRIKRNPTVRLETFEPTQHIDIQRLLRGAWGVWFSTDEQPTAITLRFSLFVRKRLYENRWHPSERKHDDENGYVIWQAEIDEPQEMLPWIRG
jgi:CRISPR-associated endonuclease/helicase Cas3